LTTEI